MASFSKYNGPWTKETMAHLLRRTTFGVPYKELGGLLNLGMDGLLAKLFEPKALPSPPINYVSGDDTNVPIGQTWVNKVAIAGTQGYRVPSMNAWSIEQIFNSPLNITEKMTLFWHNHFVVADLNNDARLYYYNIQLLRKNALGDFRQLTKDVTIDPGMLNYLNGRENTNVAPNENYARELMELFTLGKGDVAGPGDYTTFTELDVKEIAKALTGWVDTRNVDIPSAEFRSGRHDTSIKKLSARFNNAQITNAGENEYKNVIDLIFTRPEVATFICRKFYKWFVSPSINNEIEADIIAPMAMLLRQSNYKVEPVIKALLSSEHFYDECVRGTIIKNPMDFIISPIMKFNVPFKEDNSIKLYELGTIYGSTFNLQMAYFQAPNVAGWSAFYQEPALDGLWLNSATLPARKRVMDLIMGPGLAVVRRINSVTETISRIKVDHIAYLNQLPKPDDIDSVLNETLSYAFCQPLAANQLAVLKGILANNWTSAQWKTAYEAYKANPTNDALKTPLITRLTNLLVYMHRMPEAQLS